MMNSAIHHAVNIVASSNITKKTVFALKARPAIAPKGLQSGVFTEIVNETGNENGNEFNRLRVAVQLEAKDTKGQPFKVEKSYNLLPNGRGLNAFIKDYNSWTGTELTEESMYEFDGDSMVKDKPVVVEIDHSEKGKELIPVIKSFLPATAVETLAA